ncbi:MAG: hypothetical protein II507_02535 [Treponema sp.]|jgi:hypothetical protein|nr:hypothetical protein [Treponema sp.]MBQ2355757.1 hypothetical protein [Treponema sp.]MBQ2463846.1 hypothetical protein [Treponema sp.]MBQ5448615.1 hypothetical protein [Treponema sp.]
MNSSAKIGCRFSCALVAIICLGLIFSSCSAKKEIVFNPTDESALELGITWAVVTVPYAAYYKEHNYQSDVVQNARQGDILQVKGKYIEPNVQDINSVSAWYQFDYGWLDNVSIKLYDNRLKANAAAKALSESK